MSDVICPRAKTCGAKMVPSGKDSKVMIPSCAHMVKHEPTNACKNPVCLAAAPNNSACVPVEEESSGADKVLETISQ
jgi:hypothetical protein